MQHAVVRVSLLAFMLAGCSLTTGLDGFSSDGSKSADDGNLARNENPPAPSEQQQKQPPPDTNGAIVLAPGSALTKPLSPFCDRLIPRPTLCLDFDRAPELGDWEKVTGNGGDVVPSTIDTRTALQVRIANPTGEAAAALRKRVVFASPQTVVLAFDAYVLERNPTKKFDLTTIDFTSPTGVYELQIEQDNSGELALVEKKPGATVDTTYPLARTLEDKKWTRIVLTIQLRPTDNTGTATVKVGTDPIVGELPKLAPPANVRDPLFYVGDPKQDDGPFTVGFDEVVVDVR